MTLDVRSLRLVVLGAWAACLGWLAASGDVARYLGARTVWVAWFGTVALVVAWALYCWASDGVPSARARPSRSEALGLLALLAPVLVAFTMADAALGSQAASRKLASRGVDVSKLAGHLAAGSPGATFLGLNVVERHPGEAAQYGLTPGSGVRVQGFVLSPARRPGGAFRVARMYITCCVADSIALGADVHPVRRVPAYRRDTWVEVGGTIRRRAGHLWIDAAYVDQIPAPARPYASFAP
jgi:uncharacterized repeat protein (TIGR03943 family)